MEDWKIIWLLLAQFGASLHTCAEFNCWLQTAVQKTGFGKKFRLELKKSDLRNVHCLDEVSGLASLAQVFRLVPVKMQSSDCQLKEKLQILQSEDCIVMCPSHET